MIIYDLKNLNNLSSSIISEKYINEELSCNPFGHFLFYIKDKEIIGFIYFSDIYERAEINQVEVKLENRNQKIGTNMFINLINYLKKDITLEVNVNNENAIKLYKKFNFKEKTIRKNYYNGIDAILMERKENNKDSL